MVYGTKHINLNSLQLEPLLWGLSHSLMPLRLSLELLWRRRRSRRLKLLVYDNEDGGEPPKIWLALRLNELSQW